MSGLAPANRGVEVEVLPGPVPEGFGFISPYTPTHMVAVTTSATGQFMVNVFLQASDYGYANLSDPEGHQSFARFVLPFMRARMGNPAFYSFNLADNSPLIGQFQSFSTPVTLSVQSKRGYIKDIVQANAIPSTGFFMWPSYYDDNVNLQGLLVGGDVITMASPLGSHMVFTLPTITAYADSDTDVVTGTAPPSSVVWVRLGYGYPSPNPFPIVTPTPPAPPATAIATAIPGSATNTPVPAQDQRGGVTEWGPNTSPLPSGVIVSQVVTVAADGVFTVAFANVAGITPYMVGELEWTSPEGYVAVQTFRVQGNCAPQLVSVNLSSSIIGIDQLPNCPVYQVRLLDAAGNVKESSYMGGSIVGKLFQQPILPNDMLELSGIGEMQRTRMPALSVVLNPVSEVISATLLPNQEIAVSVNNASHIVRGIYTGSTYFTATVGSSGLFTRSLSGTVGVAPSTVARVQFGSQPTFIIESVVPWMRARLYQPLVEFVIVDSSATSVTMLAAGAITPTNPEPISTGAFGPIYPSNLSRVLEPGDQITLTSPQQTISLTLPALSAKLDVVSRTVTGKAPPNAVMQVLVYEYGSNSSVRTVGSSLVGQYVTATAKGEFTATLTGMGNLVPNGLLLYFAPSGNEVALEFGVPRWFVTIGDAFVSAHSLSARGLMSLTLRSAAGAVKSRITVTIDSLGMLNVQLTQPVKGGDRIELAVPGAPVVFEVPAYAVEHNAGRKLVQGVAAPNTLVQINLPLYSPQTGYGQATRRIQTDASGRFILDVADLPLRFMDIGQIFTTDANGNNIRLTFKMEGTQRFFPIVFRQGS
ncbi:MAG: hypothetical protein HC853_12165 [Anaerolineae bacterium]|nr:hypothetical protein [Anaerolineae bacterium]